MSNHVCIYCNVLMVSSGGSHICPKCGDTTVEKEQG